MVEEATSTEAFSFRSISPWFTLPRAVRLAFDARKLVLAAMGLIALQAGWSFLDVFLPDTKPVTSNLFDTFALPRPEYPFSVQLWEAWRVAPWSLTEPARVLAEPLFALFEWAKGWRWMTHALLAALWAIAVWGIVGGAISRLTLVEVCRMRRLGASGAVRFAIRFALALMGTPLCVLVAVVMCALPCVGFGLLYRLPAVIGGVLAGVFLFVPLALGLVMSLMVLGLAAAWPLMHASVAAEAEDTLDSLSRTFSYLNQRPAMVACWAGAAWLLGSAGFLLAQVLAASVLHLAAWGMSLTAPASSLAGLGYPVPAGTAIPRIDASFQVFWRDLISLFAHSWAYAYYWSSASLLYLLIRHTVDGTAWSEISDGRTGPAGGSL
jgi:hypothetical protein